MSDKSPEAAGRQQRRGVVPAGAAINFSPKQQLFVAAYVETGNGAESARRAGYAKGSAGVQARRLLAMPKIKAAVEAKRAALEKRTDITLDEQIRRFETLRDEAREAQQYTAACKCEEAIAKMLGHLVDRKDMRLDLTVRDHRTDDEIKARIAALQEELGPVIDGEAVRLPQ